MLKDSEWYIEASNPDDFIIPKCIVCGHEIDCIAEVPCETHMHTKCFNEVKNGMKGND